MIGLFGFIGVDSKLASEKEKFQNKKHNKKLYQNNKPKRLSKSHSLEAFIIEQPDALNKWFFHK